MDVQRRRARVERLDGPCMVIEGALETCPEARTRGGIHATAAATPERGVDDGIDRLRAPAGLTVRGDPGWHRAVVAQEMEREAHLALAGVVVELEATSTARQVVEVAGLLRLADEPLGDRLPGGADAIRALGVTPDGGAARGFATGQCVVPLTVCRS